MSSAASTGPNLLEPSAPLYDEDPVNETLEAYAEQEQFLSSQETYHGFISGIGAGKTAAGIIRVLLNVQYWNPGETGMIIAPTVPALRNVIIPELRKWNVLNLCEYKASENLLVFPNGSRVILESADNERKIDRLRGPSIAWFWMDEAAVIDKQAWDILLGRLRTGEYRNASITTTPKGFNWVYDRFGPDEERPQTNSILKVPSTANPHTPDDYKNQIIEEFEGSFYEQEVLGAFTHFEGLVYPWFGEDHLTDEPPDDYDEVIYGVDWGFSNPAVVLAVTREGDRWTVVDTWYETRCTTGDQATAVKDMQGRWGPGPIYCDPSEPSDIEEFHREELAARPAANDVTPGIKHVSSLRDELRVVRTCQPVRNEFNQYQYKDDDEKDAPIKQNDHAMDALRYALFTHMATGTPNRRTPSSAGKRNIS